MGLIIPKNPHQKDAEAAGKWVAACLRVTHKAYRDVPVDAIAQIARWAGHWGVLALRVEGQ